MSKHLPIRVLGAVALLAGLAACAADPAGQFKDPVDRPGTWRPADVNRANLEAMVANPDHLRSGVGTPTERGEAGAAAATRLLLDRRRRLPGSGISTVGGSQQEQAGQAVPGLGGLLGIPGGGGAR